MTARNGGSVPSVTIVLLAVAQGLSGTVVSLLTTISSLVGAMLAPSPVLATAPVTATVLGAALMVYSVAGLMQRLGRRAAFLAGSGLGVAGSAVAAVGIYASSFAVFVAGTFVLGLFTAFHQYYRFAAADTARTPEHRARAISYVTAGGIIGGFLGPFVASRSADGLTAHPFLGAFLAVGLVLVLAAIVQLGLPGQAPAEKRVAPDEPARPVGQILRSHGFVIGTMNCAIGYGVMVMLMNATPLAMQSAGFTLEQSSTIMQWHFVAMYAPALIGGILIPRLGITRVLVLGAAVNVVGTLVAISGLSYWQFWIALVCFGVGWNFMFNGGTALLVSASRPADKRRTEGLNSLIVYTSNAVGSVLVAPMLVIGGWNAVNLVSLPFLAAAAAATLWAARSTGRAVSDAPRP